MSRTIYFKTISSTKRQVNIYTVQYTDEQINRCTEVQHLFTLYSIQMN